MDLDVELVQLGSLKVFPGNPRRGDIKAIAKSLAENQQYRPIVVQKSTNFVLAGNHTMMAAKSLKWRRIAATVIDVDDDTAKRIVVADNRTSDLAEWDNAALAAILRSLDEPTRGTGYNDADIALLLSSMDEAVAATVEAAIDPEAQPFDPPEDDRPGIAELMGGTPDGEERDTFDDDTLSELQGALALKDEMKLPSDNEWGVPILRDDMLVDELPQPLDTWAGKDATPDDGLTTWLWNYGTGSSTGLPFDRAILSFFTWDEKFQGFHDYPSFYVAKMLNAGIKMAVVPDFSFYDDWCKAVHLYSVFKAQWLGRYFQEAGIKVIPRLQVSMTYDSTDISLLGIPKNPPLLATSIQNPGVDQKRADDTMAKCLDIIKPGHLIVYGGNPGQRIGRSLAANAGIDCTCLMNYVGKRRGVVFDKKEGLAGNATARKKFSGTKTKRTRPHEDEDE